MKSSLTVISGLTNKLVVGGASTRRARRRNDGRAAQWQCRDRGSDRSDRGRHDLQRGAVQSIEVGVTPATPNGPRRTRWPPSRTRERTRRTCADFDPKSVFNRLFTGTTTTTTTTDQATKLANVRKSVLDAVLADGTALEKKLGVGGQAAARTAPDVHPRNRGAARDDADPPLTATMCTAPTAPTTGKDTNSEAPPAVNSAMADLRSRARLRPDAGADVRVLAAGRARLLSVTSDRT